jgi:ubiquinone/menaquinone biosynthesis C-methylase UbiE
MAATTIRETPDVETASEDYARRFAGAAGLYLLAEQERAVRAALPGWHGGSVLDVGGGHAQLLPLFTELGGRVLVFGSEEQSLARAQQEFPGCRVATGDLLELPFADRSFDLVVAVRLISHIRQWRTLVTELCRVADRSVLIDYPRVAGFNALTPLMFPLKKRIEGNTRYYRNFHDREVDEAFAAAGFVPKSREAQFLLPMVLHRRLAAPAVLRQLERLSRSLRLTQVFGSPVVLRADRRGIP